MQLHILGIGGTFMAGIAMLAKEAGHQVSGADLAVYPPMDQQLLQAGIHFSQGYEETSVNLNADCQVIGNVMKRGQPATELILREKLNYCSAPEWLSRYILPGKIVLAVSGTHGKTTTTSLVTWLLEYAGYEPGFLIGGIPDNFGISARIGGGKYFVIEADEYDSAFFDKRSKFIHYHPDFLILNNLEFDHADIFPNLDAIKQQFHYLIRTVPDNGKIIFNAEDQNIAEVLQKACYTPCESFGVQTGDWSANLLSEDGSVFEVFYQNQSQGIASWNLLGKHNVMNALAAFSMCHSIGASISIMLEALPHFKNVKRRLEIKANIHGITIYDDFAHHPTAIQTTLAGLKAKLAKQNKKHKIIAVLEFASHTMRMGVHKDKIELALQDADEIYCLIPQSDPWQLSEKLNQFSKPAKGFFDLEKLSQTLLESLQTDDHVLIMSNGGFGGLHQKVIQGLNEKVF